MGRNNIGQVNSIELTLMLVGRRQSELMDLPRYVNLGGRNRPLACEDAQPEDLLPADDKSWDRGVYINPCTKRTKHVTEQH